MSSGAPGLRGAGATAAATATGFRRRRRRRVEETGTGEGETIETGGYLYFVVGRAHAKCACVCLLRGLVATCSGHVFVLGWQGRWIYTPFAGVDRRVVKRLLSAEQWDDTPKYGTWCAFEIVKRDANRNRQGRGWYESAYLMSQLSSCVLRGSGENMAGEWIHRPTVRIGDHGGQIDFHPSFWLLARFAPNACVSGAPFATAAARVEAFFLPIPAVASCSVIRQLATCLGYVLRGLGVLV